MIDMPKPPLGPAIPIGFGGVLEWLMENGYMRPPAVGVLGRRKRKTASKPVSGARKASARSRAYGRAFRRLSPLYKKKSGGWKKDGFKRCVRAAHKACKKGAK